MANVITAGTDAPLMHPYFNDEETRFLEQVQAFVEHEVLPNTRAWEDAMVFPDEIWARMGDLGLLSMTVPTEFGGPGFSCVTYVEACRMLAHGDPALSMNVAAVNALAVGHLVHFASEEQREKYLVPCMTGRIKMAWALTEPDAGSDARRVQTRATAIDGEPGWYHLNGQKMFITNGGKADLLIVIARTGEKELSAFLMERDQPGYQNLQRIPTVGVRASNTVRFDLVNARAWHTPSSFDQAIGLLYRGRLGIAAMAVGIAEKAHACALEYGQQREQFNRKLVDMQSVQNMIADSATELEAARLMLYKGAEMFDRGENVVKISSMAKLFASETANRVTNRAVQIHGGRGMTHDFLAEKLWRDAKLTEIGEGCSEIQRMVIAKQELRG